MSRGKGRRKARQTRAAAPPEDEGTQRAVSLRTVTMAGLILLAAGGIVGLSVAVPDRDAAPVVQPVAATSTPNASGGGTPRPFQYDPVNNRHWDPRPGHMHWHSGPPPANLATTSSQTTPKTRVIQSGSFSGSPTAVLDQLGSTSGSASGSASKSPTPNIANPKPWQYDPVTNKYWDPTPGHQHWHDGLPPPGTGR